MHSVRKLLEVVPLGIVFCASSCWCLFSLFNFVVLSHWMKCALDVIALGSEVNWSRKHKLFKFSLYVFRLKKQAVHSNDSRSRIFSYFQYMLPIAVHSWRFLALDSPHLLSFISLLALRYCSWRFLVQEATCIEWLSKVWFVRVLKLQMGNPLPVSRPGTCLNALSSIRQAYMFWVVLKNKVRVQHWAWREGVQLEAIIQTHRRSFDESWLCH